MENVALNSVKLVSNYSKLCCLLNELSRKIKSTKILMYLETDHKCSFTFLRSVFTVCFINVAPM